MVFLSYLTYIWIYIAVFVAFIVVRRRKQRKQQLSAVIDTYNENDAKHQHQQQAYSHTSISLEPMTKPHPNDSPSSVYSSLHTPSNNTPFQSNQKIPSFQKQPAVGTPYSVISPSSSKPLLPARETQVTNNGYSQVPPQTGSFANRSKTNNGQSSPSPSSFSGSSNVFNKSSQFLVQWKEIQIINEIGRGSYGIVFKGKCLYYDINYDSISLVCRF